MTEQAPAPAAPPQPQSTPDAPSQSRPEGLPQNFQSVEALATSYQELQRRLSTQTQQAPSPQTPSGPADFGSLIKQAQEQYAHGGQIAPGTYEAFKQHNLQRGDVDFYVNAAASHQAQQVKTLMDSLGGEQQYQAVKQWGAQNLDQGMQSYFDSLVQGGHLEAAQIFMQGLAAQMQSRGSTPDQSMIQPNQAASPGPGAGYNSKSEWQADMNKPEYSRDETYRNQVDQKAMNAIRRGVW